MSDHADDLLPYHRIARQFYNRPLLLAPSAAETISTFLTSRFNAGPRGRAGNDDGGETRQYFEAQRNPDGSYTGSAPRASRFYGDYPVDPDSGGRPKPYRRTASGTAIVTLVGEFVNRGAWVGASSGLVSYEALKYQLLQAMADPRATSIVLDMESPGGEATGAFEAAALVRAARQAKPVVAVVNGMAASAGYAIVSGATRIITTPTGLSGSIGVVWLHLDYSKWLAAEGIRPTFIFAGDHKVDGNPFEPLPDSVRKECQREIDQFYSLFVDTVAAGRLHLSKDAVRGTQARCFIGRDAVAAGLADDVGTFEEVLAELSRQ